ncbi:hypothetical protein QM150_00460 [Klebsiella pneumoniae]
MSISLKPWEISETLFILTIPLMASSLAATALRTRVLMLISIVAWMLRFGLFGRLKPLATRRRSALYCWCCRLWIVYGCAFDFFNISGSVFVEKEVRPELAKRHPRQRSGDVPDDDRFRQPQVNQANGFGCIGLGGMVSGKVVEHFDGVGQGIHTVEGITDWQSVEHHAGVVNGDIRDQVRVADHLFRRLFAIDNYRGAGLCLRRAGGAVQIQTRQTTDRRPAERVIGKSKTPRLFGGAFFYPFST